MALGPKASRAVIAQCRIFERYLLGQAPSPYPQLERGRRDVIEPAPSPTSEPAPLTVSDLAEATGRGAWHTLVRDGVAPSLVARLKEHIEQAAEEDVLEMRPFALADQWGTDRRDTLVAFLHATTAGIVHMSWKVLCPNCRISKAGFASLADIKDQAHCETCNITFDAMVDRQVEVRFTVVEAIRHVEDRRFCAGGPQNLPHVVAQTELDPGETREITIALPAAAFRLRSLQCATNAVLETASTNGTGDASRTTDERAHETVEHTTFTLTPAAILPPLAGADAGSTTLRIVNQTGVTATLVVERPDWPDDAATASLVSTLQEFRDLFGKEALAPGLQLAIQRLAFLFTDLTGSTAMYQAIGQARAFRLVQDHFGLLVGSIDENNGALVKTIGDAIMAAFPTGADAFSAALAMQREIRKLDVSDVSDAVDTATLLKIGVHEGPCIAVGANDRLDYFGTTINVAARVQSEAHGGEIVITKEVFDLPSVQSALRDLSLDTTQSEVQLRGVRDAVRLYRLSGVQAPDVAATEGVPVAGDSDRKRSAAASPV
jgi:adenylate cyclase